MAASLCEGLLGSVYGIDVESLLLWTISLACISIFCYGVRTNNKLGCVSFPDLCLAMIAWAVMGTMVVLLAAEMVKDTIRHCG
ncbi:hypothetical protein PG995_000369 [Apiospora arundinis]